MDCLALLEKHGLTRALDERHIRLLASDAAFVRFAPDALLFHEGDEATRLFLIVKGRVALEVHDPRRGAMVLETLGDGDLLGLSWLTPPYVWRLDARAVEEVEAVALPTASLRARMDADPQLAAALLRAIAAEVVSRLSRTRLQRVDLYRVEG